MLGAEKRQCSCEDVDAMHAACRALAGALVGCRSPSMCPGNHLLDGKEEAGPQLSGWLLTLGSRGLDSTRRLLQTWAASPPGHLGGHSWAGQSSSGSRGLR